MNRTMQSVAVGVLIALLSAHAMAQTSKVPAKPQSWDGSRLILFDTENGPPGYPEINPYDVLASLNCWTTPVLDHTGKPHHHGHLIQLIMDGGNGKQDEPNADGSPGGDDSLAYGDFNMMRITGIESMTDSVGQTGLFASWKYFVPFIPGRVYYLRLWEGKSVATAPYYQDTIEYDAGTDRGGALISLKFGTPMDVDWKFGPSKARPKGPAPKPKTKS
jgi:hypothetical protein